MTSCLILTQNRHTAQAAECTGANARHRRYPDVRYWWPEMGFERLQGLRFDVVICDLGFRITHELESRIRAQFDRDEHTKVLFL